MRYRSSVIVLIMATLAACSITARSTSSDTMPNTTSVTDSTETVTDKGAAAVSQTGPLVESQKGLLRGTTTGSIAGFRGIPYAAPPVGDLRWRPPQEFPAWEGERNATEFGAACPQPAVPPPFGISSPWSEDCLTLNIWTPEAAFEDGRKRPVLFWIHGGAFLIGSGSQPLYEGSKLAALDVVVVTINYRLGALGFLAHPSLSAEQPGGSLGNYGLLDQIAALRWVRTNIAQFGGDIDNVTIMGESSGGVCVTSLMISSLAEGLYSKAIAQSSGGTAIFPKTQGAANSGEAIGSSWTTKLGLGSNPTVNEMRAVPANSIAESDFFSFPNIDGVTLMHSPGDAFARGEQAAVPFLTGSNSFEGSLPTITDAMAQASLPLNYAQFIDRYAQRDASPLAPKDELRGELFFVQPTRFLAERQAATGAPGYLYFFDQVPEGLRSSVPAATHGGELAYLFGTEYPSGSWDDTDRKVAHLMMDRWVAFARTGNPNIPNAPTWPAVDSQPAKALILSSSGGIRAVDDLDKDMLDAAIGVAKFLWGQP